MRFIMGRFLDSGSDMGASKHWPCQLTKRRDGIENGKTGNGNRQKLSGIDKKD
jgi:hypothetical protein